jgi:hypothetical protein
MYGSVITSFGSGIIASRGRPLVFRSLFCNRPRFTLNYLAMINRSEKLNTIFILLLTLTASCSAPPENVGNANANSAQQAGAAKTEPPVAQSGTPTATGNPSTAQPPGAQTAPVQPASPPAGDVVKPAEKAAADSAAKGRAPRLLVPDKKLDFGKQPQDKTLARTFQIKNVGNADLLIESVTPS